MSERVFAFVDEWVSEHIHSGDLPSQGDPSQAAALARQCIQDAEAAGIPTAEINDAYEDLAAFMAGQIAEANEGEADEMQDQMDRLKDEADASDDDADESEVEDNSTA
jgi:hypothetical protein